MYYSKYTNGHNIPKLTSKILFNKVAILVPSYACTPQIASRNRSSVQFSSTFDFDLDFEFTKLRMLFYIKCKKSVTS